MAGIFWFLFVSHFGIALLWVWALLWVRGLRTDNQVQLKPLPDLPPDPASPSLGVFIAAHNERERIEGCLRRLLSQNYPQLRITVVNDRSDDRTGELVRAIMASEPRVNLVEIDRLPHGWVGKTHALAAACTRIDTDYLLFMDCDCRLAPGAIAAVMKKVVSEKIAFLTLWPRLDLLSRSERILTPAASWLLGLWGLLRARRGSANSDVEIGNGQFLLFSRDAYEQTGGHAAVKAELAEDLMLAQRVAALNLPRWAGLGKGLYVTSRDNTLSATFNSLTRVLIGSLVKPGRLLISTQFFLGGVLSPFLYLAVMPYLAVTGEWAFGWAWTGLSVAHVAVMRYVVRRLFTITLENPLSFAHFVWGSLLNVGLLVWAWLVVTGIGHVRWGKTAYRVRGSQILSVLPEHGHSVAAR